MGVWYVVGQVVLEEVEVDRGPVEVPVEVPRPVDPAREAELGPLKRSVSPPEVEAPRAPQEARGPQTLQVSTH